MMFLPQHLQERFWANLVKNTSVPADALAQERGLLRGGTYMPASCAVSELAVRFIAPTVVNDKYLGAVPAQRLSVSAHPQPWTKMLEPVDYATNVRLHSTAMWSNSFTERRRHTARLNAAMRDDTTVALMHDLEGPLYEAFKEFYEYVFSEYDSRADYSLGCFDTWVAEHEASSTGMKDEMGRTMTWGRLRAMENSYQVAYKEAKIAVQNMVRGFPENEAKVMNHDYSFRPDLSFRALRNRPESDFQCRGHDKGQLSTAPGFYTTTRYRDRAAGGLRVLSWLFAFLPKEEMHKLMREGIRRGWQAAGVTTPITGPLFNGLESYIDVLTWPEEDKAYTDVANCEKFAGSQGYAMERICFRGSGEDTIYNALCELSGGAMTTDNNMLFVGVLGDAVVKERGMQPEKLVMHGDNIAFLGVPSEEAKAIEAEYSHLLSAEDIWLGHGNDRVVGLKFTKDSKDAAIALPPNIAQRPQFWRYSDVKAPEATAAMLCRDVLYRHFDGPKYTDFLKQVVDRVPEASVEQILGSWDGLSDKVERLASSSSSDGLELPTFQVALGLVKEHSRELFSQ